MAGTLAATEIGGGSSLGVVQQGMESHGLVPHGTLSQWDSLL